MTNCDKAAQIHAYHDGELDAAARAAVEAHVQRCGECRALLDELRGLTRMLLTVPLPQVHDASMRRMQGAWFAARDARDRGVRRLAGWLTTAAAAVLLIVVFFQSPMNRPDVMQSAGNQGAPVMPGGEESLALSYLPPALPRDDSNAELVQVAQWMVSDLSVGGPR
jgi:anti-sigma factor RsiW